MHAEFPADSIGTQDSSTAPGLARRIDTDGATDTKGDMATYDGTTTATPAATLAETEVLGETIAALAARLHAATYELLVLLRAFDERASWNKRLPVMRALVALAHRHRPRRRPRESASGQGIGGASAHQRGDAVWHHLVRQGAGALARRDA